MNEELIKDTLIKALAGGVGGAALGGAKEYFSNGEEGETPEKRRERIVNTALMTGGLGALAGGGGNLAVKALQGKADLGSNAPAATGAPAFTGPADMLGHAIAPDSLGGAALGTGAAGLGGGAYLYAKHGIPQEEAFSKITNKLIPEISARSLKGSIFADPRLAAQAAGRTKEISEDVGKLKGVAQEFAPWYDKLFKGGRGTLTELLSRVVPKGTAAVGGEFDAASKALQSHLGINDTAARKMLNEALAGSEGAGGLARGLKNVGSKTLRYGGIPAGLAATAMAIAAAARGTGALSSSSTEAAK